MEQQAICVLSARVYLINLHTSAAIRTNEKTKKNYFPAGNKTFRISITLHLAITTERGPCTTRLGTGSHAFHSRLLSKLLWSFICEIPHCLIDFQPAYAHQKGTQCDKYFEAILRHTRVLAQRKDFKPESISQPQEFRVSHDEYLPTTRRNFRTRRHSHTEISLPRSQPPWCDTPDTTGRSSRNFNAWILIGIRRDISFNGWNQSHPYGQTLKTEPMLGVQRAADY